jgi:hypothetical protein
MKAIYALAFVCMSLQAFTASADTLDDSTAVDYPSYLGFDDFDFDVPGETTAQSMTRVPGLVIAPTVEPDTLVFDHDGVDYNVDYNKADTVPGIAAIESGDEDPTGTVADLWDF